MISKEEFKKVWKDTKMAGILNQFYYEHNELMNLRQRIDKAIEYIKEHYPTSTINDQDDKHKLLNILEGDEAE